MDDNFAARSLLNQFDPDAYKIAYERKEYEAIPNVGIVLKSDINKAIAAAKAAGSPTIDVQAVIPEDAAADLKAGRVTPAAFDSVFGKGAANKTLQAGGQTGSAPSGNFQGQ
jgi:hypothetical protein